MRRTDRSFLRSVDIGIVATDCRGALGVQFALRTSIRHQVVARLVGRNAPRRDFNLSARILRLSCTGYSNKVSSTLGNVGISNFLSRSSGW